MTKTGGVYILICMARRTVVMVVMDGWGIGRHDDSNAIYSQNPRNIDYIKHHYPAGALQASSIAVGLPWNEEGNSEVGHLTLGAGRVIYQHFPRISIALHNGSFFKNQVLLDAVKNAKDKGTALNAVGILTDGNVHASFEHLIGLIQLAKKEGLPKINLHLFTDGKDGPPKKAKELLDALSAETHKIEYDGVRIGSIGGRYYGMDRDQHWNRTERAYVVIANNANQTPNNANGEGAIANNDGGLAKAKEIIEASYKQGLTDEFVEPGVVDPEAMVKDGDSVIFFNYREDSIRQLVEIFMNPAAINGEIPQTKDLYLCSFTEYSKQFKFPVAFPPEDVVNPLGKILADNGKVQLRIAETNKYAHVTYFFNGFVEAPFKNEYRILVPSQNVARYDEYPEMMAKEITARAIEAVSENAYDFILINYANTDIVAHTGNFEATKKAVATVDEQIGRLMEEVLRVDGVMLITSDHGNAERISDPMTGLPETKHDSSAVPIYLVAKEFEKGKDDGRVEMAEKQVAGILSDVAPTILELLKVPKPIEITGESLLKLLN